MENIYFVFITNNVELVNSKCDFYSFSFILKCVIFFVCERVSEQRIYSYCYHLCRSAFIGYFSNGIPFPVPIPNRDAHVDLLHPLHLFRLYSRLMLNYFGFTGIRFPAILHLIPSSPFCFFFFVFIVSSFFYYCSCV